MKTALLISSLLLPLCAMAASTIYTHTSASSNTGGNTAEDGGTVETGNANSSVHTETTSNDGESTTQIHTETNGVVHDETVTGETNVQVDVKATPEGADVKVQKGDTVTETHYDASGDETSSRQSDEVTFDLDAEANNLSSTIFVTLSGWFSGFLHLFGW